MVNNTAHSRYDNILGVMPEVSATPGSVVSFDDGAENIPVKKLKVAIEPVQSGSGDPSPDNIRLISGWTGAKVTKTGKNLLPTTLVETSRSGITVTQKTDGSIVLNGTATDVVTFRCQSSSFKLYHNSSLWLSGCPAGGDSATKYSLRLDGRLDNGTYSGYSSYDTGRGTAISIDSEIVGKRLLYCIVIRKNTVCNNLTFKPMLNVGTSAEPYEPYVGETIYPIDFPSEAGTVYCGSLEINEDGSGTLKVDKKLFRIGSISWDIGSASNHTVCSPNISDIKTGGKVVCETYKTYNKTISSSYQVTENNVVYTFEAFNGIGMRDDRFDVSTEEGRAAFIEPIKDNYMVYPLKNVKTYTLTASQVTTLLGTNNIWADTGDISELTYRADVPLTIEKLKNAIVSLGGTV